MKKYFLPLLVLWIAIEAGHQLYLSKKYTVGGKFNWSYYAYSRNAQDIDELFKLCDEKLNQRVSLEVRSGAVKDSSGVIPIEIRESVLELAEDIAPWESFVFSFYPRQAGVKPVAIQSHCLTPNENGCNCIEFIPSAVNHGAILNFYCFTNDRNRNYDHIDYIRTDNDYSSVILDRSTCYFKLKNDQYIAVDNKSWEGLVNYNSGIWDLLAVKLVRDFL